MKRRELIQLWNHLHSESINKIEGTRFQHGIVKNKRIIKGEIEELQEMQKPSKGFMEFQTKRVDLCKKFAELDEKGNPKKAAKEYVIKDKDAFEAAFSELKKEYDEVIKKEEAKTVEFNKILEDDVTIEFYKIKEEYLPDNLGKETIEILFDLIAWAEK